MRARECKKNGASTKVVSSLGRLRAVDDPEGRQSTECGLGERPPPECAESGREWRSFGGFFSISTSLWITCGEGLEHLMEARIPRLLVIIVDPRKLASGVVCQRVSGVSSSDKPASGWTRGRRTQTQDLTWSRRHRRAGRCLCGHWE